MAPVQCAPRNVPVAKDGHLTTVTQPTDWIRNLVIVKKTDKLRLCIDPKPLNLALNQAVPLSNEEDVLYKLPKARIFTLVDAQDVFLQCRLYEKESAG